MSDTTNKVTLFLPEIFFCIFIINAVFHLYALFTGINSGLNPPITLIMIILLRVNILFQSAQKIKSRYFILM